MAPKILLVEDNPDISEMMGVYLRGSGFQVSLAANSSAGILKAANERPDLILTDLLLPDMTADQAIVKLKRDPATADIPVIVLTAMASPSWKFKALQAGAAEYLLKPIMFPILTDAIRKLIPPRSIFTES